MGVEADEFEDMGRPKSALEKVDSCGVRTWSIEGEERHDERNDVIQ